MPWPLSQDYNEAIQNPQTSCADPELRGGQAVTNALGMPMPRSGNFADVYEFIGASGAKWAIKCFTRAVPGLRERYTEISKHLIQAKLPFTVDFEFLERGLRIRGDWYPVLKMQWVEGFLLNEFVRNNLDNAAVLDGLGHIWLRMAKRLRGANLAHADLQHGNIILVPGRKDNALAVKLIDYDGMWVPALANKKSGEFGHANYQHPQRLQLKIYNAEVDRLPLLVIACALRALSVAGRPLWDRYDNGDNLLFRDADLRQPGQSRLFKELWNLQDGAAHDLLGYLALALARPLVQTPLLSDHLTDQETHETKPLTPDREEAVTAILGQGATVSRGIDSRTFQAVRKASSLSENLEDEQAVSALPQLRSRGKASVLIGAGPLLLVALAVGLGIFITRKSDGPEKQQDKQVQANPQPKPETKVEPSADPSTKPESAPIPDPKAGSQPNPKSLLELETNLDNLQTYLALEFPELPVDGMQGNIGYFFKLMDRHKELAKYPTIREIKKLLDSTEKARDALRKELPSTDSSSELLRALLFMNSSVRSSLVLSGQMQNGITKYAPLMAKSTKDPDGKIVTVPKEDPNLPAKIGFGDKPETSGPKKTSPIAKSENQTNDLRGTQWTGSETLPGFGKLTFQFITDSAATMIDARDTSRGSYMHTGNKVTITFGGGVIYNGTINGNTMSGSATNGQDKWNWTVNRASAEPSKTTPTKTLPPMETKQAKKEKVNETTPKLVAGSPVVPKVTAAAPEHPKQKQINQAIDQGVAFLKMNQLQSGGWPTNSGLNSLVFNYDVGYASLAGLTLLECQVPADDPAVQKAAALVRSTRINQSHRNYEMACAILFLDRLGNPKDRTVIQSYALALLAGQSIRGGWGYNSPELNDQEKRQLLTFLEATRLSSTAAPDLPNTNDKPAQDNKTPAKKTGGSKPKPAVPPVQSLSGNVASIPLVNNYYYPKGKPVVTGNPLVTEDNCNTQFAMLGLWTARRHGVPAELCLVAAANRYRLSQNPADGGWGYQMAGGSANPLTRSTPAMICVGLLGLAMGHSVADKQTGKLTEDPAIDRGLRKLGAHITAAEMGNFYFMWAVERVGMLYQLKTIGNMDWYEVGADMLLSSQKQDGSWSVQSYQGSTTVLDTCFALQFLKRSNLLQDLTERLRPLTAVKQKLLYLSDMAEFDVKVYREMGKKGNTGWGGRITVNGVESPNGLSLHSLEKSFSAAKYRLGKRASNFIASVAVNDSADPPPATPLVFLVLGDGKVLWKSKPVDRTRLVHECKVDVTGIDVLELRVDCPGPFTNAQSVWLEPRVLLK